MKYIEILGGLTSRLSVLASLVENGYHQNYKLIWDNTQPGCNCYFHDLFVNNFNFVDKKTVKFEDRNIQTYGDRLGIYDYYTDILPSNVDRSKVKDCETSIDHDRDYIIMDWPLNHNQEFLENTCLKQLVSRLKLQPDLLRELNSTISKFTTDIIGLQFRGCLNTINYLHGLSNIDNAIKLVYILLETHKQIFICTGSQEFLDKIKHLDGVVYLDDTKWPIDAGYSTKGVQRALLDWLLLSKVKKAYIENNGYARKACIINNTEYQFI